MRLVNKVLYEEGTRDDILPTNIIVLSWGVAG